MGSGLINQYPQPHYNIVSGAITRKGLAWRFHKSDDNLNTQLSECTSAEWATLQNTATQAAFNTAATVIWGATYTGLPVGAKGGMKQIIDAGLP